ncbi:MAG TPA: hypothetical protein VKQ36_02810 [Ktedonobacterales bacterium]|nr:hypothetical protein [Ktedonobacterales bacterium]
MAQSSEMQHSSPPTPSTVRPVETAPTPSANTPSQKGKIGRRALLAAGGVGACAVGVALVPVAISELENYASNQAHQALENGIQQGEQAIINDLAVLEGVALDDAILVAKWTKLGVDYIVRPVATVVAAIGDAALSGLSAALGDLDGGLHAVHVDITQIHALRQIVQSWHDNVNKLPIALTAYGDADSEAALKYLQALKKKVDEQQKSTS